MPLSPCLSSRGHVGTTWHCPLLWCPWSHSVLPKGEPLRQRTGQSQGQPSRGTECDTKISGDLGRKTGHGFWKSRLYPPGGITTFITTFTCRWLPGTERGGIQQQFDDEHHKQHAALSLLSCMLRHTHHFKHRHTDQRAPNAGLGKNIRISPEGREPRLSRQQLPGTFQQK